MDTQQSFRPRDKHLTQDKIVRTALMRAREASGADIETLPIGSVVQVYSLYCEVEHAGTTYLAVVRKTLAKVSDTRVIVGDRVRLRPLDSSVATPDASPAGRADDRAQWPEAVIEQILPRHSLLTRADSFKAIEQHPIVANARQMLIVASLRLPAVKWGLVDRMLIAAQAGNLLPIVCLNKIDLAGSASNDTAAEKPSAPESSGDDPKRPDANLREAQEVLAHYGSIGVRTLCTSAEGCIGLDELRAVLRDSETVLAGHSGVGKSTLINAIQPNLNLRTAQISGYTSKGRHTTTSARRYPLDFGGAVIDTPGVKLFGLWNVTADNLLSFFPDITSGTAPAWRRESYERIFSSLPNT